METAITAITDCSEEQQRSLINGITKSVESFESILIDMYHINA